MTTKKEAPDSGEAVQGRTFTTNRAYPINSRLSMAGEILMLIEQAPAHADRLRGACWDKLETTLRRHYAERGKI